MASLNSFELEVLESADFESLLLISKKFSDGESIASKYVVIGIQSVFKAHFPIF